MNRTFQRGTVKEEKRETLERERSEAIEKATSVNAIKRKEIDALMLTELSTILNTLTDFKVSTEKRKFGENEIIKFSNILDILSELEVFLDLESSNSDIKALLDENRKDVNIFASDFSDPKSVCML